MKMPNVVSEEGLDGDQKIRVHSGFKSKKMRHGIFPMTVWFLEPKLTHWCYAQQVICLTIL